MMRAGWIVLAAGMLLHAQPRTVIQTETRLVVVDAVVTGKKGERTSGLSKKDFHIWEDNKEQTLQMFSFEADPSHTSEPQRLILFFDNQSVRPADQVRARIAAASFIDAHTEANRLMAVLDYDGALRVAQNFTDNPGRLKDAINGTRYAGISAVSTIPASTAMTMAGIADMNSRGLTGALTGLARNLAAVPGRKTVVVISGGTPVSTDSNRDVGAAIEALNRANTGLYAIDLSDPMSLSGAGTADSGMTDTQVARYPSLGRGGGGARGTQNAAANRTDEQVDNRVLIALAQGSGGFVVRDANDLLHGLQEVGKEQSEYYVLGYTPPESKDGSCHSLRVKVDRSGVNVRARSSYCSSKTQDVLAGSAAAKNLENRAVAAQTGNVTASMQVPFFYAGSNVARARVAMEIIPEALKFEAKNGKQHAELNVLGIASTADGDVAARFSDVVNLVVDDKKAPIRYEKEFKIAPGQYKFTVVFSSGGAGFGKLEAPLVIEPYDKGSLGISGIAFSKETHPASDLGLDAGLFEDTTPLIANGVEFVPATSNKFTKSDLAVFYVELYAPASSEVGIRLRVIDTKSGEQKIDTGLMKVEHPKSAAGVIPLAQRISVNELVSGTYTLEVTARDEAGKESKRSANFEVR